MHGQRLRGTAGDGPKGPRSPLPKIWGAGRPMHSSPLDILRSSVIGCEANYEMTKNGVKEEFFVLKSRFLVKKRVIYQDKEIESMTKKVVRWAVKWNFFPKNGDSKIWSAKFFLRPPKLGAKSPPMVAGIIIRWATLKQTLSTTCKAFFWSSAVHCSYCIQPLQEKEANEMKTHCIGENERNYSETDEALVIFLLFLFLISTKAFSFRLFATEWKRMWVNSF